MRNIEVQKHLIFIRLFQEYVENSAKALEALKERQAGAGESSAKVIQVAEAEDDETEH